ncbi:MAG: DNA repair protein RecO [Caldisericia bacterium]|nr:DNA repair protein RecO [Caldisericia bacterium]
MEIIKLKGYILKKVPIKEDDLLIFLYTDMVGKIVAKARGATKINNKWSRIIETLNLIDTNIYKKNDYFYLTESKIIDSFFPIKRDFNKSIFALQIINIIDKTQIDNNPDINIFNLITNTLNIIKENDDIDIIFLSFILNLLKFEGILFSLDRCERCRRELSNDIYFNFKYGAFLCDKDKDESSIEVKKEKLLKLENYIDNRKEGFVLDKDEILNIFKILNYMLIKNFSFNLPDDIFISYIYN